MSNFVTGTSHKSRKTALLLCVFGGFFGLHNFYVGKYGRGFLYLLTVGLFMFGWFFDIFKITLGRFKDQYGNYLIEW